MTRHTINEFADKTRSELINLVRHHQKEAKEVRAAAIELLDGLYDYDMVQITGTPIERCQELLRIIRDER